MPTRKLAPGPLDVRRALLDAAARVLAEQGPASARRLVKEAGASTMAVHTHFGSMISRSAREATTRRRRLPSGPRFPEAASYSAGSAISAVPTGRKPRRA
ncbi:TetR family transcriptional regulator [Streptomyces sannanensis]